jgi:hypothetical protein
MTTADWSDIENDMIVAGYFAMLSDDLSGRRYNKAAQRDRLSAGLCIGSRQLSQMASVTI